jgi:hypothetical protein
MAKMKFSFDGGRPKVSRDCPEQLLQEQLDRIQAKWSENIMPRVAPGEFDPNNASEVNRVSRNVLEIITTGSHKLVWRIK